MISQAEFQAFIHEGVNYIPMTKTIVCDQFTALGLYSKLAHVPYTYLLESVTGGERWGRYSIIGLQADTRIEVRNKTLTVSYKDQIVESIADHDPIAYIERYIQDMKVAKLLDQSRYTGGLAGYFGYESIAYFEPKKMEFVLNKPHPLDTPDIMLMLSKDLIVLDNLLSTATLVTLVDVRSENYECGVKRLQTMEEQIFETYHPMRLTTKNTIVESDFISDLGQDKFEKIVKDIKEYILDGDVMQVVPSQRLSTEYTHDPIHVYRALRHLNPSPYMYYFNMGDFQIVGASPEILVKVDDESQVHVRPIAGTRKRGKDEVHDKLLEAELINDPKEIAEHVMLIDLGRNDIGRVCEPGSVQVTESMAVERYSHVMHIVSHVQGKLLQGKTTFDALRSTFPAGTLSGAPKIRAMQLIGQMEPYKRGIYGGACGVIGWQGEMDLAIAIRTAVVKDNNIYAQAGAGVVADSIPMQEWKETLNKSRALMNAVELTTRG